MIFIEIYWKFTRKLASIRDRNNFMPTEGSSKLGQFSLSFPEPIVLLLGLLQKLLANETAINILIMVAGIILGVLIGASITSMAKYYRRRRHQRRMARKSAAVSSPPKVSSPSRTGSSTQDLYPSRTSRVLSVQVPIEQQQTIWNFQ